MQDNITPIFNNRKSNPLPSGFAIGEEVVLRPITGKIIRVTFVDDPRKPGNMVILYTVLLGNGQLAEYVPGEELRTEKEWQNQSDFINKFTYQHPAFITDGMEAAEQTPVDIEEPVVAEGEWDNPLTGELPSPDAISDPHAQ